MWFIVLAHAAPTATAHKPEIATSLAVASMVTPSPVPINVTVTMSDRGTASSPLVVRSADEEGPWKRVAGYANDFGTPIFTLLLVIVTWQLVRVTGVLVVETNLLRRLSQRAAADVLLMENPRLVVTLTLDNSDRYTLLKIKNHGRTATDIQRSLLLFTTDGLPAEPMYQEGQAANPPAGMRALPIDGEVVLHHPTGLTAAQRSLIADKQRTLHAYGFIDYLDAAQCERRLGICMTFKVTPTPAQGLYSTHGTDAKLHGEWLETPGALMYDSAKEKHQKS